MSRALFMAVAVALAAHGVATARPTPPTFDARGCQSTLHVFLDDPARLQPRYVPNSYSLLTWVPGKPYIALWSFSCDALGVEGGPARPAQLSVAAIPIHHPDRLATGQAPVEMPNLWSHYTHRFVTDDAGLAAALRREGLPARVEADMSFHDVAVLDLPAPLLPLTEARVDVPGHWSSWTQPVIQQEPAHSHANEFWFDAPDGPVALNLRIPEARDHFCELATGEQCGTADAPTGSETAAFLGAPHRAADAAVDHAKIERIIAFASGR